MNLEAVYGWSVCKLAALRKQAQNTENMDHFCCIINEFHTQFCVLVFMLTFGCSQTFSCFAHFTRLSLKSKCWFPTIIAGHWRAIRHQASPAKTQIQSHLKQRTGTKLSHKTKRVKLLSLQSYPHIVLLIDESHVLYSGSMWLQNWIQIWSQLKQLSAR